MEKDKSECKERVRGIRRECDFFRAKVKWKEIYNSEEEMKIMYNGWERGITTTGKKIKVGDGTTRTFHAVMAT